MVGEARYGFEAGAASFEFGISIDDRWQGHGIGTALMRNLECRAAAFGVARLFGDTLRSNDVMIGLARKSGFDFMPSPGDWKLVDPCRLSSDCGGFVCKLKSLVVCEPAR